MMNKVAHASPHRSYPEIAKGIGNEAQSHDIVVYPRASISPRHHSPTAPPACTTCLRGNPSNGFCFDSAGHSAHQLTSVLGPNIRQGWCTTGLTYYVPLSEL